MKKFSRLSPEQRKEEIQAAALELFNRKGYAATTMENIVEQVTLSKGGVYRIYPSTQAILSDLMIRGMQLRNEYYEQRVQEEIARGRKLSMGFLVDIIGDSLLMYPEFSTVYVEFLWEKQRNEALEKLYREICTAAGAQTMALMRKYGADALISGEKNLFRLTELMNGAILSLRVLHLESLFAEEKDKICRAILQILEN